jgi:Protein of unknown function (DUF3617)
LITTDTALGLDEGLFGKTPMISRLLAFAFAIAASSFVAADPLINAGLWETTAQMELQGMKLPPGMAGAARPMTTTACFTAEDIAKATDEFPMPADGTCKRSDYSQTGKRVTFTLECGEATMKYDTTIDSLDAYHGTFVSQAKAGPEMSASFSAKRIADDCTE